MGTVALPCCGWSLVNTKIKLSNYVSVEVFDLALTNELAIYLSMKYGLE
jgi:hypothetical protein